MGFGCETKTNGICYQIQVYDAGGKPYGNLFTVGNLDLVGAIIGQAQSTLERAGEGAKLKTKNKEISDKFPQVEFAGVL